MVRYASPRSLDNPRVVLLHGVNLYPSFSSLFSLSLSLCLLAHVWCSCVFVVGLCVVGWCLLVGKFGLAV